MPLDRPTGVTVTIAANATTGTFNGDISARGYQAGMALFPGSRSGPQGSGRVITSITLTGNPAGSTGGSFTIEEAFPSGVAYTTAPFVIETYAMNVSLGMQNSFRITNLLNALAAFFGLSLTLDQASKTFQRNRAAGAGTFFKDIYTLAGVSWFAVTHATVGAKERYVIAAITDGTTETPAVDVDGTTGGVKTLSDEGSVASAATCDISAPRTGRVLVTGTTTITSFGSAKRQMILVRFAASLVLTHNASSFNIQGGANITTAAGDTVWALSDGNGNWTLTGYERASGRALAPTLSYSSQLVVSVTSAGAKTTGLALVNPDNTANTKVALDLVPNTAGLATRSAQVGATCDPNASSTTIFFATANGDLPTERLKVDHTAFLPAVDAVYNLGSGGKRFANSYFSVSPTVGSDRRLKANEREVSEAERRVAGRLAAMPCVYQMRDAIAAKGEAAARLHVGLIAQDVAAAFDAEGLDPRRYALFCEDPLSHQVERVFKVRRPVMDLVETTEIEIVDGEPVLRRTQIEQPRMVSRPVLNEDGHPIAGMDHPVPVTTEVEETRLVEEPLLDEDGHPVTRLGLRYEQLLVFVATAFATREAA